MFPRRGNALAVLLLAAAAMLPESGATIVVRRVALGYLLVDWVLQARSGYLRRRPYWTRESWRQYLFACSVFAGAIAIMFAMTLAVDWHVPIAGAARSVTRFAWVGVALVFMFIGAVGLASAVHWLTHGDPSRQFELPRWVGGRHESSPDPTPIHR